MPASQLLELVEAGKIDAFEARCLELLESGTISLAALVAPLERLRRNGGNRVATLGQMVLENADPNADPAAALTIARFALEADPNNAALRKQVLDLYPRVHGDRPGFTAILERSGLASDRAARSALRLLDLCLHLKPGDALLSRMESKAVEVVDFDPDNGLFTLRREGRRTTLPAAELAAEYDRADPDDFRVLQQLNPERLKELIHSDPVALVSGLLQAHGGTLDAEELKHELTPKYVSAKDWSKWWSDARAAFKRSPHIIMEGRSPVILRYSSKGQTLEDETWATLAAVSDPIKWLTAIEGYLREKTRNKETPDAGLLERFQTHIVGYLNAIRAKRPAEALACGLVLEKLGQQGFALKEAARGLATAMLRDATKPAALIAALESDALWELGLKLLPEARPQDWAGHLTTLLPTAPAVALDQIAAAALTAGHQDAVQKQIQAALDDPLHHPETIYWLWKGPQQREALGAPEAEALFARIIDTLSNVGRKSADKAEATKRFRHRVKAALELRDFKQVRQCLERTDEGRAVKLRRQFERLEGLGDNAKTRLIDLLREIHPQLWFVQQTQLAPWQDPDTLWTTSAGLHRKTEERDQLVNVTMRDNARRIGEAAALGDLSENSEYKFALEERDLLRARLAKMNADLSQARLLDPADTPTDQIGIGSRVTLRDAASAAPRVMTFLGPFEADVERGVFNYLAPTSQKLMGLRVGERVKVSLDGQEHELEVVTIENALLAPAPS